MSWLLGWLAIAALVGIAVGRLLRWGGAADEDFVEDPEDWNPR